jgi:short-subunit dehydrogenase
VSEAVLILGAGSGIGRAFARALAEQHCSLILAGRRHDDLERIAADCRVRYGARAEVEVFDALALDEHARFFARCHEHFETGLDAVVLCHGEMPEEDEARADPRVAKRMIDVNYTSAVSILERAGSYLEERRHGWICAISSVAGDRGRPGNYLYGSTKAALNAYLQGLRSRLAKCGVSVVTVKPGFVDTGMTFGRPGMFLVASPAHVARDALRAIRRDRPVVYTPAFWRVIMLVIRMLPDWLYKRLTI